MHARAKLLGHPVHQMLIVLPLGLFATSVVPDVIYEVNGNDRWAFVSFFMIGAGILGALGAAVFGLVDWLGIPKGTRAKRIGAWHGIGNLAVVVLFALSWALRVSDYAYTTAWPLVLSIAGVAVSALTGWLGGELVDRLGVGVHDGAHVDAPSSLRARSS